MERTAGEACTPFRSLDAARFRETLGTRWIAFEPIGQVRPTIICTQPRTNLGCLSLYRHVFTVLKKKKKKRVLCFFLNKLLTQKKSVGMVTLVDLNSTTYAKKSSGPVSDTCAA